MTDKTKCWTDKDMDVVRAEAYEQGAKDEREKILNGKISNDVLADADFIEALSALEHKQWEHWSRELSKRMEKTCIENNGLIAFSMEMKQRWTPNWKPYEELPEDVKEHDRKWARLAASICNQGYSFCYEKGKQAGRDEMKNPTSIGSCRVCNEDDAVVKAYEQGVKDEAKRIFEKLDKIINEDLGTPAHGKNKGRMCFLFPVADYNELKKECGVDNK